MQAPNLSMWHSAVEEYIVTYAITENQNVCYGEDTIREFGIECFLHKGDVQISFESIDCISPDYEKVFHMVQTLKRFQVFPAHLKEVVSELAECDEQGLIRLLCA